MNCFLSSEVDKWNRSLNGRTLERNKAEGLHLGTCGHVRTHVTYSFNAQIGGPFSETKRKASRPGGPNELLQTRDHFDRKSQFVRSPINHLECDVDNHSQADIRDPAMILQQASNEARRDAHQAN